MLAYASGGYGFSYSGVEGTGNWNTPEGRLWDGVLISTPDPPDALLRPLTPAEVAAVFRVDPKTVTRWAVAGKLTAVRTLGGHRRYRASEVQDLLRNSTQPQWSATSVTAGSPSTSCASGRTTWPATSPARPR